MLPRRPQPRPATAARLATFPFGREVARASIAFALYLLLQPLWIQSGLQSAYVHFLFSVGRAILEATRHFSAVPNDGIPDASGFHSNIPLLLALALVSTRMEIRRRIRVFGILGLIFVLLEIVSASLAVQLQMAKGVFGQHRILLLLPAEFNALEQVWYLTYILPLQGGPFLLFILTALWNGGAFSPRASLRSPGGNSGEIHKVAVQSSGRRYRWGWWVAAGLAVAGVLGLGLSWWNVRRESLPLHVDSHAKLGDWLFRAGRLEAAETEYKAAVKAGSQDGEAWYNLALIARLQGRPKESARLLDRGLEVVEDPYWREWMLKVPREAGASDARSSGASFIVVRPPDGR